MVFLPVKKLQEEVNLAEILFRPSFYGNNVLAERLVHILLVVVYWLKVTKHVVELFIFI